MIANTMLFFGLALALTFFGWRRLKTYLHLFQQHEYDGKRMLLWSLHEGVFDKRLSICLAIVMLIINLYPEPSALMVDGLLVFLFTAFALIESNPQKKAKKALVMTARAKRIIMIALGLTFLCALGFIAITDLTTPLTYLSLIAFIHILPLMLILANLALVPYENHVQKRFWHEAHDKLATLAPTVIGITGSFGKTSIKHILGHILSLHAKTLMTPGSVNTPMGIARIIREQLDPSHKFFIAEMGAYGPGSIKRLCDLAPPDQAIITSIGQAHFERFASLDTVAEAKFELADAVSGRHGLVFFPTTLTHFKRAKTFIAEHPNTARPIKVEEDGSDTSSTSIRLIKAKQTDQGLNLTIEDNGHETEYLCPLYGLHQASNIILAYALARHFEISHETLKVAFSTMPQIAHRLEVKSQQGWILVDDAYNANPSGMASGMDLLSVLQKGKGRRIMITPGCVELGQRHDSEHERLGHLAAHKVDILIIIKPERIKAMIKGFEEAKTIQKKKDPKAETSQLITFPTFTAAQRWLLSQAATGDAVLIANDLPDIYESKITM